MTRTAYFDCPAGASGDMVLGALVDAGWPIERLADVVADLGLAGRAAVRAEPVRRGPLVATQVTGEDLDPDPPHRNLPDILALLDASRLPPTVATGASAVFTRLAEAEAAVHGVDLSEIHFHEVGALDTVVDVAGAVAGLAELGVSAVWCSPLPAGGGWTASQHGPLPLPAPATLQLLARARAPLVPPPGGLEQPGELVTPTGAAILCTLGRFGRPAISLDRVGHGAGGRDTPWPNVLRLWLGTATSAETALAAADDEALVLVETNIDDMVPELYGHVSERLFALGALDVWLTPVQMKKGRPGTLLSALVPAALEGLAATCLLEQTTTLGVRVQPVRRHVAGREIRLVHTAFGQLPVKVKWLGGRAVGLAPEYDACRAAAIAHDVPLARVYEAARAAAELGAADGLD
jgi:hypothetical protein